MIILVTSLIAALAMTVPVVCVVGTPQEVPSYSKRCNSLVGIPGTLGVPMAAIIALVGLAAIVYVDRHE